MFFFVRVTKFFRLGDFCILLQADEVVMDLCKLFQCSLMEEFNEIMTDNVKSMSVSNTSEWWAQRTRLDSKMKVQLSE